MTNAVIEPLIEPVALDLPERPVGQSMLRGMRYCCPNCGGSGLFARFLKVRPTCGHCHEELHHHRADDAPPYFTILIVGHLIIGLVLSVEVAFSPPLWVQAAIWAPLTLALSLLLLPRIKGALVGLQWSLYMHGFNPAERDEDPAGTGAAVEH